MTPLGHAALAHLAGALARLPAPRLPLAAVVVGGVLPDLDFVLVGAPGFNAWHRVITHNLAFVGAGALAGALVWRSAAGRAAVGLGLVVGGLVHLAADACVDTNPSNGIGVALLWPWSAAMWSPVNLAPIDANPAGWGDPGRAAAAVLRTLGWEAPLWLASAALVWRGRAGRPRR